MRRKREENLSDVKVLFGGGFEELEVQLLGEFLGPFGGHSPRCLEVFLVAYEHHLRVVPRIGLYLRHPASTHHTPDKSTSSLLYYDIFHRAGGRG